ncbi:TetR/AcrR family transcriptional regulator [Jidongwangia harbinensis]|uniref:TetR/AcrR family transcriptional regulator n=1 Tax=Jidongwangia harbinensis TaxID=2878561 RepID=UPI001CD9FE60|nr:TetR/AcrR family transcriptional regulator [Jidongwangia harbinensis]MCA2218735.1 TetR/AcrR family transcriptional regulator [Jidongwangia harbinensis]
MAKRQARFTLQDLEDDPRLQDDSPDLWDSGLGEVTRSLLTSAVRCFAANGFHATTTRDISAGVGLSPAALYVHFPSKELVLYEIARAGHERALDCVRDPAIEQAEDSAERLSRIVARYTAWHARHHVAARVCQYELGGLTTEHHDEILELRHRTNEVFRDTVARGIADGTFAPIDIKRAVRGILSLSIDLARWYRLDGSDTPEQLGEFYAELALRMVTNTPRAERAVPAPAGRPGGRPRARA